MILRPYTKISNDGGRDIVGFRDEQGVEIVKVYMDAKQEHIRIVLPELANMAQVKIDVDHHLVDFERDPAAAKRWVAERERKARGR